MFKNQSCLTKFRYFLTQKPIHKILSVLLIVGALNASATTYYVSSSGNDSNSGTSESQAWKTLTKVNSFTPRAGDQILFRRGDSWVGTLVVRASGSAGNPIVYGAYGSGNKPIIYGSEQITGWTHHSGNIYKANVGKNVTQLFLDNVRMKLARNINSGYMTITSVLNSTTFSSDDLNPNISYSGAHFTGRTNGWSVITKPVEAFSGRTIKLESAPSGGLDVGHGFYLNNRLEFVDSPGEWYFDKNSGTIYFWTPTGASPASYHVRGTTVNNNVTIDERDHITIRDFDLRHAAQRGITADYCAYLTIDNNQISSPEMDGILFTNGKSNHNTVTNNTIDGANYHGIQAWTSNSVFADNIITNTAMFENLGLTGMSVASAGRGIDLNGRGNTIRYNRIIGSGYLGIGLYQAPNTLIEYNYIQDVCLDKEDGGAIYMWESNVSNEGCTGTVIRGNIVINAAGTRAGLVSGYRVAAYGIFMDDNIRDIIIENNTISECGSSCIFLHLNKNITVRNNTAFMGLRRALLISGDYGGSKITNNTFYAQNNAEGDWLVPLIFEQINGNASFSNNKYIAHYSTKTFRHQHEDYTFNEWRSSGQDANSYVDHSPLAAGEKEVIFYNDTKQSKSFSLGGYVHRDIYGTEITSLTLEPFTSKILIKTTKVISGSNESPVIENQTFTTSGGKQTGEFIAQVVASDPDANQNLSYAIVSDNSGGYFAINPDNGRLTAKKPFPASGNYTVVLRVSVSDDASSPLTASANITVNITESVANQSPVIQNQTLTTTGGQKAGDLVGQVVATDPDDGQTLSYAIVQDNSGGYFSINSSGQLRAAKAIPASGDHTAIVRVSVTDNAASPLTASADVTIQVTNTPAPGSSYSEYLMEEPTGSKVYDSQGANHGTIMNSVIRTFGVKGSGIGIDGTNYVNMGQVFGDNVTDEVSLSAWIKPMAAYGDWQAIIVHGGPNFNTFGLYIRPGSREIGFKTTGTTNEIMTTTAGAHLWDGNWHQLTATYDGSTKVIYIDGEVIRSVSAVGNIDSGEGYNLSIGAVTEQASPNSIYYGYIDEVRIYNYVLGTLEIGNLYASVNNLKSAAIPESNTSNLATLPYLEKAKNVVDNNHEGMTDFMDQNDFKLYPNPANSFVQIDFPVLPDQKTQIIIVDGTGRTVLTTQVESTRTRIDLGHLSPGLYYVKSLNQASGPVKKLIISN